jgi:hypothetical protein
MAFLLAVQITACRKAPPKTKGIGDSLKAFIVQDCNSEKKYCQVCAYSGKPSIMAVGAVDDKDFESDLIAIQEVITSSGGSQLTAFAVLGPFDEHGLGYFKDEAGAIKKLNAMRKKNGITFPIHILPKELSASQKQNYATFARAYDVPKSRTIFFAEADNKIRFAGVITNSSSTAQFTALKKLALKK